MDSIASIIIGAVFVVLGIVNYRGNVSMLHSYHKKRVSEEDMPAFARLVGIGTVIVGASLILMGGFSLASSLLQSIPLLIVGNILLGVGLVTGLGLTFYALKKYNKGIF